MNQLRESFLVAVFAALFLVGCGEKQNATQELRIGAVLPLSGNVAFVGEPERAALMLAAEDIKQQYGGKIKVRLIIEDSAGDPKTAVTATNKLINVDKVNALLVSLSKINHAVAPAILGQNVLHFATTTSDIGVTGITPFTFRIYENFGTEMALIARYAKKVGVKELIGVRTHDYAIDQAFEVLKTQSLALGIQISDGAVFEPGNKDYRDELQKLPKSLRQDQALIFLGYGPEFPNALKTLKELNRGNGRKLGMYTFLTGAARSQGVELLQGVQFSGFAKTPDDPQLSRLTERVKALSPQFSSTPFINYVYTYDAMMLLAKAASQLDGKYAADDLSKKIIAEKKYSGVGGEISITEQRDSVIPMSMFEYSNSNLVLVMSGTDKERAR